MNPNSNESPDTCSPALRRKVLGEKNAKKSGWLKRAAKTIKKAAAPRRPSHSEYSNLSATTNKKSKWLHTEEVLDAGVAFQIKYFGTTLLEQDMDAGTGSQEYALSVARQFFKQNNNNMKDVRLDLATNKITVTDRSTQQIMFRHSVSRVAFFTVDPADSTAFYYVAQKKNTESVFRMHMFRAINEHQGFEITFTAAQAFHIFFQELKEENNPSELNGSLLEPTLEPPVTWAPKEAQHSLA
eukprot:m.55962 g.55962  ORF g.55962 m.55962 type:complete len:241 (+) comp22159_c0_seq1:63-785(+)